MDHEKHLAELAAFLERYPREWSSEHPQAIRWALAEIVHLRRCVAEREAELADMEPME